MDSTIIDKKIDCAKERYELLCTIKKDVKKQLSIIESEFLSRFSNFEIKKALINTHLILEIWTNIRSDNKKLDFDYWKDIKDNLPEKLNFKGKGIWIILYPDGVHWDIDMERWRWQKKLKEKEDTR